MEGLTKQYPQHSMHVCLCMIGTFEIIMNQYHSFFYISRFLQHPRVCLVIFITKIKLYMQYNTDHAKGVHTSAQRIKAGHNKAATVTSDA